MRVRNKYEGDRLTAGYWDIQTNNYLIYNWEIHPKIINNVGHLERAGLPTLLAAVLEIC